MGAIAYDCKYIRKVIILKEKLIRFMYGRYGMDSLGKFTIIAGLIVMLIAGCKNSFILSLVAWFCIIYAYFRMFSRNIYKRSSEVRLYKMGSWLLFQGLGSILNTGYSRVSAFGLSFWLCWQGLFPG